MRLPKTPVAVDVVIKRLVPGHYDENHKWVPASEQEIATIVNASILPKGGQERAETLQTKYESDYTMWFGSEDITFREGYSKLQSGDIILDSKGRRFISVFIGDYGIAYKVSLKEELKEEAGDAD